MSDDFDDLPLLKDLREALRCHFRAAAAQTQPEQAKRRPRLRTRPLAVVVVMLLAGGSAAAAFTINALRSAPLSGRVPAVQGGGPRSYVFTEAGKRYEITFSPSLTAGRAGWDTTISFSANGHAVQSMGQSGGGYPTLTRSLLEGGDEGVEVINGETRGAVGDVVYYLLTGPAAAAVRVQGKTIETRSSKALPAGDRIAVFLRPAARHPGPGKVAKTPPLTLLGRDGNAIAVTRSSGTVTRLKTRSWRAPVSPTKAACALGQHDIAGLTPRSVNVAVEIKPVKNAVGEVLLSCLDAEYSYQHWPLQAAILLNGKHPGQPPGPIPAAKPLSGHPGVLNTNLASPREDVTARRVGDAWLAVGGGRGPTQRLKLLESLRITRIAAG